MKKWLSMLLSLCLLLISAGALCEGATAEVDMSEPLDIEVMAYFVMDVPADDAIVQALNEKFNVTITPTITNIDNYAQTLSMRIASGDLPDWFRVNDQAVFGQLVEDNMLLNVTQYADKYGFENIKAQCALPNANMLANDGVFYRIPDTTGGLNPGIYIRQDWMDELGLEQPKTWEDFREVLEVFVEKDPDGQGTTGWTTYGTWILDLFSTSWTGYFGWATSDGQMMNMYVDPNYKEAIKFWAGLYADKLLDPEVMVNSYEQAMQKMATGRAGAFSMNLSTVWWSNNVSNLAQYDLEAKMGALIPLPEGPKGALLGRSLGFSADSAFNGDMDETHAARMLAIMDYLLSDEGREFTLYGIEGQHHEVVDGKKVQKTDVLNKEWGQLQHLFGELADFGSNDMLAEDQEVIDWYNWVADPANVRYDMTTYMYDEEAVTINAELSEIRNNYLVSFITGEMDIDEKWDEYTQAMNDAGLPRLGEIVAEYCADMGVELPVAG